jgi:putative membrane protein
MISFLIRVAVVALGLWVASKIVPGVAVADWRTLAIAALLLGVVNALVKPVIVLLTLPITFITLGLFLVVINAAMVGLVAYFLEGFQIAGFVAALLCWVVVTVVSWVASMFIGDR